MQIFTVAYVHNRLLQVNQVILCKVVLVPGTGIAIPLHKILVFHIVFPQAVDYDMHMDVASPIMPVHVRAGESLMAGEIFVGIF